MRARVVALLREGKLSVREMAQVVASTRFGVQQVKSRAEQRGCLSFTGELRSTGLIFTLPVRRAPAAGKRKPIRSLPPNALPITATWFGTYRAPAGDFLHVALPEEPRPPRARPSEADAWSRLGNPMEGV